MSREDLEASLARVGAGVSDPRHGIHGPDSPAWKMQREAICFLGGGRAALLQLAHPFVAYGVDQHSKTRSDVIGRFQRTFMAVFAMTFGDLQEAAYDYSGSVALTQGKVVRVTPWRFLRGDEIGRAHV